MATSSRRSAGTAFRSLSPSGRFCNSSRSTIPSASAFASSTSSLFHQRSASPTPVAMFSHNSPSSTSTAAAALRFPLDRRSISPGRSISAVGNIQSHRQQIAKPQKRTCMCSPTTHPGSFRCSLHKGLNGGRGVSHAPPPSNRLNARRSAMTNSLVRICGVEGDLVKRALAALIRPSLHNQRRRADFQPRPSRFSVMSKAEDSS